MQEVAPWAPCLHWSRQALVSQSVGFVCMSWGFLPPSEGCTTPLTLYTVSYPLSLLTFFALSLFPLAFLNLYISTVYPICLSPFCLSLSLSRGEKSKDVKGSFECFSLSHNIKWFQWDLMSYACHVPIYWTCSRTWITLWRHLSKSYKKLLGRVKTCIAITNAEGIF